MYHLPGFSYDKWRHGLWQSLRDLPITRGCWWVESPDPLEALSYEGVLQDVRDSQIAQGPDRIRELLKKHIYQPVEGEVSCAVTECRVDEAERFLNQLVYGDGLGKMKYSLCPQDHIC